MTQPLSLELRCARIDLHCDASDRKRHVCQVSATLLGEPDLGLLTPPEMARKVGQICTAAKSLAVIADADSGELLHVVSL